MKRILCVVALAMLTMMSGYAQDSLQVKNMVHAMAKKYDSVKGVECVTVEKGSGLGLVKTMFNKQFGKSFMKGVTSITVIMHAIISGDAVDLALTQSASGAKYAGVLNDTNVVLWGKGDAWTMFLGPDETIIECSIK